MNAPLRKQYEIDLDRKDRREQEQQRLVSDLFTAGACSYELGGDTHTLTMLDVIEKVQCEQDEKLAELCVMSETNDIGFISCAMDYTDYVRGIAMIMSEEIAAKVHP